jgi:hypothetical protein
MPWPMNILLSGTQSQACRITDAAFRRIALYGGVSRQKITLCMVFSVAYAEWN